MRATKAWPCALWLGLLALQGGCGRASYPRADVKSPAGMGVPAPATPRFIVTFWCGPPLDDLDDHRAAEIAEAGFNVVGFPCEGAVDRARNLRALETLERHGLRAILRDPRFEWSVTEDPNWLSLVDQAVADYHASTALAGYWVEDEPQPSQFAAVGAVMRRLHDLDPDRLVYVNLLPDYVFRDPSAGTYRDYVEHFIETAHPQLLSFDYYPFLRHGDRPGFFHGLSVARAIASAHGLPFLLVLQAMPHADYRDPSFAELSWQAFHALAYGARGISYFAYWTPVNVVGADRMHFRHGLIEGGLPTNHYEEAARLNRAVVTYAHALEGAQSIAVGQAAPWGCISTLTGGPVTVGLFARGVEQLALIVNRDYERQTTLSLGLVACAERVDELDPASARWTRSNASAIGLDPGGARLLRVADAGCCPVVR
jgi:hypothetical protein